ncbi:MAG: EAL domain-containing protein [Mycobacteriales bacterium]
MTACNYSLGIVVTSLPAGAAADEDAGVLLLVEDDPDHAFLVTRRLREQLPKGWRVERLATAAAACARLSEGSVSCVVLDLSLPDARGLEAVTRMRGAASDVPIVVLTGTDDAALGRDALRLGAQDYLVKGRHGADALSRSVVFALERTRRRALEQREAMLTDRLRLVLEGSAEGICMLDASGAITFVNRAGAKLLGSDARSLSGRLLHDFHACEDAADCALAQALCSPDRHDAGEQVFRSQSGTQHVLEVRVRELGHPQTTPGLVVNMTDVTRRHQALQALAERETQLVDAQRLAHLGSWEWNLATGEVLWSDEMYAITGLAADEVPRDARAFAAYRDLTPAGEQAELDDLFGRWAADRPPAVVGHRLVRPDGTWRWLQCRASVAEAAGGQAMRVVGTVQDVTEQKAAEDALAHQALHDALTGLRNRALLLDRLDRALADPRRTAVAVVYMDLDRFKWVNDSLSHAAGDELLLAVARRLTRVIRPDDTLARFGGDEFVLMCERLQTEQQVLDVVSRICQQLEVPFMLDGREVVVTASMGLAVARAREATDSEALLRDADTAMYRAKDNGRARCEIFDEGMRLRATERLELQNELRRALQNHEFVPWYQPVVDLRSGRVVGCEALARWQHPTRGLLTPDLFIGHAEETSAIIGLGESILVDACRQVAHWNRSRPVGEALSLAVNVSARQLGSSDLIETVRAALADAGLAASQLCLEVTESVVMDDVRISGDVLGGLREIGVRTAVDDFGTGYSSLAYLLSLPVDVLKIDRSFVNSLDVADGPAVAIVRAITALADALGLGVLAEGVETTQQLGLLEVLGVQHGQGFLWGRPVPAGEASWRTWPRPAVPAARVSPDATLDARSSP